MKIHWEMSLSGHDSFHKLYVWTKQDQLLGTVRFYIKLNCMGYFISYKNSTLIVVWVGLWDCNELTIGINNRDTIKIVNTVPLGYTANEGKLNFRFGSQMNPLPTP